MTTNARNLEDWDTSANSSDLLRSPTFLVHGKWPTRWSLIIIEGMLCRIQDNIFTALTIDGTQTIAQAILAVIDNVSLLAQYSLALTQVLNQYNNMVWADVPMNQGLCFSHYLKSGI